MSDRSGWRRGDRSGRAGARLYRYALGTATLCRYDICYINTPAPGPTGVLGPGNTAMSTSMAVEEVVETEDDMSGGRGVA